MSTSAESTTQPLRVLFVCSRNRLRSPTAERVFAEWPGVQTASVGLAPDADEACTAEWLIWADQVFVMEAAHRRKLAQRFRAALADRKPICLDIPDDHDYMAPALIALLLERVPRFLR